MYLLDLTYKPCNHIYVYISPTGDTKLHNKNFYFETNYTLLIILSIFSSVQNWLQDFYLSRRLSKMRC